MTVVKAPDRGANCSSVSPQDDARRRDTRDSEADPDGGTMIAESPAELEFFARVRRAPAA